ncbi:MxcI [Pendulispora albinea]|uniref:MxcI n=1 Tax=Pendulispora albinea TaxID=2741071 RepID=A0ABZ2M933_9BACT
MNCKFNFTSWTLVAAAFCAACSSSSDGKTEGGPRFEHAYAFVTQALAPGASASTTYVNVVDSLDIAGLDRTQAREVPGLGSASAIDGKLFVANGERPAIMRFDVTNAAHWTNEGQIDFSGQGLTATAGFFQNITTGPQKAYMARNVVDRIVWNPSTLTIQGTVSGDASIQLQRDGFNVAQGYEQAVHRNRAFQPFYWASSNFIHFAPYSQIAVYDTDTDKQRALLDAPCPHLHRAAKDEEGNVYFSNGSGSATEWLFDPKAPRNCMVRIKAGQETIDQDFTIRFAGLTGGLEAAAFQYFGGDKGLLAVFDHTKVTIEPNATDDERIAVNQSANWHVWVLDVKTRTAKPLEGLDGFSGQFFTIPIDGRTFVLLPGANYGSTKVYEIVADGTAKKRFATEGWIYEMFKVR